MSKWFLTFLFSLWFGITTAADFSTANQRFASGDFTAAAADYEQILANHGPDATAYYNLGNAYQQLKQYGPAILAYERARVITPRDPDLSANLARARKAAAAFDEPGLNPRLEPILTYLSRNEWSWLVAGSTGFLGALAVVAGLLGISRRGLRQLAFGTSVVAILLIGAGATALHLRRAESRFGIVLAESATVRLSPFENAESIGTPGPGKVVRLGPEKDGYRYATLPGSTLEGWIASTDVQPIVQDPTRKPE